jgi:hypothetical protein
MLDELSRNELVKGGRDISYHWTKILKIIINYYKKMGYKDVNSAVVWMPVFM